MTDHEIAKECERLFQAGGPRVYIYNPETGAFLASAWGIDRTLKLAAAGCQVWARRKSGPFYRFIRCT